MSANREMKVKSYYEVIITLDDDAIMDQDSAIYAIETIFQLPVHNGVHRTALEAIDRIYEHECYASFRSVLTNFDVIKYDGKYNQSLQPPARAGAFLVGLRIPLLRQNRTGHDSLDLSEQ